MMNTMEMIEKLAVYAKSLLNIVEKVRNSAVADKPRDAFVQYAMA